MNSQRQYDLVPFFLDSPRGPLFCLAVKPVGVEARGSVLYLHPFAEEMHKSRRMAALQARALAAAGYLVLQVDLTGCGDSAGDFGDANWQSWHEDARLAHAWLTNQTTASITLWGLRTGATLAVDVSRKLPNIQGLILWQPVISGDIFLNQFLRIKLASEMMAEGQAQSGTKKLRAQLLQGTGVEVGGNMLSPAMAKELGALKLSDITPNCAVSWIEIAAEASEQPLPASQRVQDAWRASGVVLQTQTVVGDPFWITQEITECPMLIRATLHAMSTSSPAS
jgi:exosortase A-associated hydrolase 2